MKASQKKGNDKWLTVVISGLVLLSSRVSLLFPVVLFPRDSKLGRIGLAKHVRFSL